MGNIKYFFLKELVVYGYNCFSVFCNLWKYREFLFLDINELSEFNYLYYYLVRILVLFVNKSSGYVF